ncbi:MAG: hypothetical protein Q9157_003007 [Trypethelium eluteriae]
MPGNRNKSVGCTKSAGGNKSAESEELVATGSLPNIRENFPEIKFRDVPKEKKDREKAHRKLLRTLTSDLEVRLREHGDLVGGQSQTRNNRINSHLENVKVDILRESGRVIDQYYWVRDYVRGEIEPLAASMATEFAGTKDPKIGAKLSQLQEDLDELEDIFQGPDPSSGCQTGRSKIEDNCFQTEDDSMEDDSVKMEHDSEEPEWVLAEAPCPGDLP